MQRIGMNIKNSHFGINWILLEWMLIFLCQKKKRQQLLILKKVGNHIKSKFSNFKKKFQKPILFTEYGYRSVHFNGKQPWKVDDIEGNINFQAQVNGLQAIHNQFWKEDWFAGGFVWKWFHAHEKSGGKNNNRFTPQNKPAEKLLKKLHSN